MINNRQGGRRRGRGGQQPRGIAGNNNSGNRQDNRQRGNAAQLLEKYKSMARDSQLAGDRVQTEYYLQFADHYFRVLGESRPRVDEQRRPRDEDGYNDDDSDDRMDAEMDGDNEHDGELDDQSQQQQQRSRSEEPPPRSRRPASDRVSADRSEHRRDRPNGRAREEEEDRGRPQSRDGGNERIDFAVLPPAIGSDDDDIANRSVDRDEEEAPRPRRRVRRPRADEAGSDDAAAS